ncbi:helix-turn-helix domain-containing protein [Thermodesulfatator atlanticus]|uniref:helix-turn-helix domain-containing protein n=1 Tax=Thermodesulfatator atlanticus TaxID=501497 RepID=UPI0003B53682|nr:helix-turn-helix domain-containing protein [Thermodesulfatator atlanticus]
MTEEREKTGFGEFLRHQREIRGFTLKDISAQTKIGIRALEALEAENWEILPAEIYIKGFIRNYCETIGLDPNEALLRFEEAYAPYRRHKEEKVREEAAYVEPKKFPWVWIIGVVVLIAVVIAGYYFFTKKEQKSPETLPQIEEIPLKKEALPETGLIFPEQKPSETKTLPSEKS